MIRKVVPLLSIKNYKHTHKTLSKTEQNDLACFLETSAAAKNVNKIVRANQCLDKKRTDVKIRVCLWAFVINSKQYRHYTKEASAIQFLFQKAGIF